MTTISTYVKAYSPNPLLLMRLLSTLKQSEISSNAELTFAITKGKRKNIFVLRSHHGHSQYANEHLGIKIWKGTFSIALTDSLFLFQLYKVAQPGITIGHSTYRQKYRKEESWCWVAGQPTT